MLTSRARLSHASPLQNCKLTHLCQQLSLYFQLLVQLVLPLLKGDAAAALAVFDSDSPVVYLLQEVAGTQFIFDPQHSSPGGEDRDRRSTISTSVHRKKRETVCVCDTILKYYSL